MKPRVGAASLRTFDARASEREAQRRSSTRLTIVLVLVPSVLQALVNISLLAMGTFGYLRAFKEPPPPTLRGVAPAATGGTVQIEQGRLERGTYALPAGWKSEFGHVGGDGAMVFVHQWPIANGMAVTTAADRLRATAVQMHVDHAKLTSPREITISGWPAVEIAGACVPRP